MAQQGPGAGFSSSWTYPDPSIDSLIRSPLLQAINAETGLTQALAEPAFAHRPTAYNDTERIGVSSPAGFEKPLQGAIGVDRGLPDFPSVSIRSAARSSRPRIVKAARVRKHNKVLKRKDDFQLNDALSVIAARNKSLRVDEIQDDIEKFATRSTAERKGCANVDGRVKRPLNAFMLYRKAYKHVAMAQLKKENQDNQAVSRICGYSWSSLEAEDVRKRFKNLAATETKKHKEAHPEYKYIPRKQMLENQANPNEFLGNLDENHIIPDSQSSLQPRSAGFESVFPSGLSHRETPPAPAFDTTPQHFNMQQPGSYWGPSQGMYNGVNDLSFCDKYQDIDLQYESSGPNQPGIFTSTMDQSQFQMPAPNGASSVFQNDVLFTNVGYSAPVSELNNNGCIDPKLFLPRPASSTSQTFQETLPGTQPLMWSSPTKQILNSLHDQPFPDLQHQKWLEDARMGWEAEQLPMGDVDDWLNDYIP